MSARAENRCAIVIAGGAPGGPIDTRTSVRALRSCVGGLASVIGVERILLVSDDPGLAAGFTHELPGIQALLQPGDKGTAAALMVGMAHLWAQPWGRRSTIFVVSASSTLRCPQTMLDGLARAEQVSREGERPLAVLGLRPDQPRPGSAWVLPGRNLASGMGRAVRGFVERASLLHATRLARLGALENASILVGASGSLWKLACERMPWLAALFMGYAEALGTRREEGLLAAIYAKLSPRDLGSAIFARPSAFAVVPVPSLDRDAPVVPSMPRRILDARPTEPDAACL